LHLHGVERGKTSVREDWSRRAIYGRGMRRFVFLRCPIVLFFAVASDRKQHEFFEAIVLACEMTAALLRTPVPPSPTDE
jgi:hypothetical protein